MVPKQPTSEELAAKAILEQNKSKEEQTALDRLVNQAKGADIEAIAPAEVQKKEWHNAEDINQFVNKVSTNLGIAPQVALIAIILLFNKGAANEGTPSTMFVTVTGETSSTTDVSKNDLIYNSHFLFKGLAP